MPRVYMDHAATTPLFPEVVELMTEFLKNHYGNPSSLHSYGLDAKNHLDKAREQVAALINAEAANITFTSGGTEADNLAILGMARKKGKGHLITSAVEHHAVLDTFKYLSKQGFDLTILPVDEYGMVSADDLKNALRDDTILVSIMHANNEVGTVNPIKEIGKILRDSPAVFHVDAVQSVGKIPVDVEDLQVDMLTYSAHKINGPKGIGILYKRSGLSLERVVHGGGQEKRLRSGTENLPGIVGMGLAAEITKKTMADFIPQYKQLRDHFMSRVLNEVPFSRLNGHPIERLPHNANLSFDYIEGEALLLHLDLQGIACSAGSACSSSSLEPSHVLKAMNLDPKWAHSALRFTLGLGNDLAQMDYAVDVIKDKVALLRKASPFYNENHFQGKKSAHGGK